MMNKFALSLVFPIVLGACTIQPLNADPESQLVNNSHLKSVISDHEEQLIQEFTKQNDDLKQTNQKLISSLHSEIRNLKDKLPSAYRTSIENMNVQHNNATVYLENKTQDGKMILGEHEIVWLDDAQSAFSARIDTGATTSSLNALDITTFERDGDPWVSFNLPIPDTEDQAKVETPILRKVRIRQASAEEIDQRPVIKLTMRIGDHVEKVEFTLADRSKMNHPVLLGREFLKDIAVVDIARQNAQGKPVISSTKEK